jgi:amidase
MDVSGAVDGAGPAVRSAADTVGLPATEIARLVRSGEVSAVDIVRAHLDHIDAVDARVGAFRVVRREPALAEAHAIDTALTRFALPLAGVPIAVKDNVAVAGEVMTVGSSARATAAPETRDHPVVARLRKAGAVIVGITRVPELCLYASTDGPGTVTRNPWDTARSSGGSSGGSAAAVASGSVPLAHGNDSMGSLRIPAAANGLVTLKPGRGVVPADLGADGWSDMGANGALATTVADLALAHAVLAGEQPGDVPVPDRPLRIAVSLRSPVRGAGPDAATRAAVEAVVTDLIAAGHTVVRRDPPITTGVAAGGIARWMAGAEDDAAHLGIDRADLLPRTRTHARVGRMMRRAGMLRPRTAERFRERMVAFFDDVDVLLTPVTNGPPLPARPWHERSFMANLAANTRWVPWNAAWNLAGLPAAAVPAGTRPDGLPVGVQIIGPPGAEGRLLWLAGELERRQPWRRYAPVFDPTAPRAPAPA